MRKNQADHQFSNVFVFFYFVASCRTQNKKNQLEKLIVFTFVTKLTFCHKIGVFSILFFKNNAAKNYALLRSDKKVMQMMVFVGYIATYFCL